MTNKRTPRASSADDAPDRREPGTFPIVGIGASAGGLEAFTELLRHLLADTGMAFVLVQHLDPQHDSALTRLLSRATSLPVLDIEDGQRVEADHVYVITPNTSLGIAAGVLSVQTRPQARVPHRPIDAFFEALAQDQRERAIGVVLSGTANDGTLGLEAIKAEGGITFAQDDSAKYDSMPHSAVAAGCVDFVLSPEHIAGELARIATHPYLLGQSPETPTPAEDEAASATAHSDDETPLPSGGRRSQRTGAKQARAEAERDEESSEPNDTAEGFKKILLLLRNHSGVDFSLYKSNTIQRRVARRLVLNKQTSLADYAGFLRGNAKELDALYSDVLISVTSFFRNPEAFDALKREVLPKLLSQPGDDPLRAWVLGCSTGQEAYSLAIAFVEAADEVPRARRLQVFATDLNDALLDKARHGLYAKSLAQDIAPERLRRFFVEEEGGYRISKMLREMVVFARQNLISDPPFSRMDLISCRNLLIYLEPSLQKKAMPTFHYALRPERFLWLGVSESIGGFTELFEPVDRKQKIYVKKAAPTAAFHLPLGKARDERSLPSLPMARGEPAEGLRGGLDAQREADRIVVNRFAPPGVLIDDQLQVLQFRGPTDRYLSPPRGRASFDVLKMAREGLMLPLRAAIRQARKDGRAARKDNVRVHVNGETRTLSVEAIPLRNQPERSFLILFEEADTAGGGRADRRPAPARRLPRDEAARRIDELESELAETRDYLQTMQEQHDAVNEELQAANEEAQSANEELQSINEELETAKEELESANEELATVNEEMTNRNAELNRLNNDLVNTQTSARLAIVLLGRDLTIRRFSAQAEKQLGLMAADRGRPLGHVRHNLVLDPQAGEESPPDLESLAEGVVAGVREEVREVRDQAGRWYSLQLRPYMTLDNKVDGAMLMLTDIDALKRSEQAIAAARDYAESVIETVREPLLVLDERMRVERANRAFYRTFEVGPAETLGERVFDLGNRQWDIPRLRELLEQILPQEISIEDFKVEHDFEQLGQRSMRLNARQILDSQRGSRRVLLAIEDVTEGQRAGEANARLAAIVESSDDAIISKSLDGTIRSWNAGAQRLFGYTAEQAVGQNITLIIPADRIDEEIRILASLRTGERVEHHDTMRQRSDGELVPVSLTISPIKDEAGRVIGASKIARDITERNLIERGIAEKAEELAAMNRRKDEFLAMLSHELRNPMAAIFNALQLVQQEPDGSEPQREAWGVIERQLRHMSRLVDDLLEVSRITTGRIRLRTDRVNLASVIERAVERMRPLIERRGQRLAISLAADGGVWLDADSARLEQVLDNLLDNAAKYSRDGGRIALSVERDNDQAVIRIRDEGDGMAAEMLPRVFDLFSQGEQSLDRAQGGLGIGLALVKSLVELHRGSVAAHSEGIGQGSEFVVRLPLVSSSASPAQQPAPSIAAPPPTAIQDAVLRILVVDDNADAARMSAMLLRSWGHDVGVAHDGPGALQSAAEIRPHVILLDIGLPDMDGFEVSRRLRQDPQFQDVRIVAVTGYGQDADRQRSKAAGFDLHLVKPVETDDLRELLDGFLPPAS